MKTYVLCTLFNLLVITTVCGKIINGYEKDVHSARTSLKYLAQMPDHRKVKIEMERLKKIISYYEITGKLLSQFKAIAPSLYNQIDTIVDFRGRPVDVYLKFAIRSELPAHSLATTNIGQLPEDKHAYHSNYGPHTVSIKIAIVNNSLLILAHEFGHVRYQVPNLASYMEFFSKHYLYNTLDHGHNPHDPSGQNALRFEKEFQENILRSKKIINLRPKSPPILFDSLRDASVTARPKNTRA